MKHNTWRERTIRWFLSVALIVLGVLVTWAWGHVARLAAAPEQELPAESAVLYAAWQQDAAGRAGLFQTVDEGATWQPVSLPGSVEPVGWASDGQDRLAVTLADGSLLRSENRGRDSTAVADVGPVLSLAWGEAGVLYAGLERGGVYRLPAGGEPQPISAGVAELASASIAHLAFVDGRLFAATPGVVFYSDDGGQAWVKSLPSPAPITALAAADRETLYVGTETVGVYRSSDAGRTWVPAVDGLGLAAGQSVHVTALQADPREPGVLYAGVSYAVGGTRVVSSAAGIFGTVDGGQSWQPLAGPRFPDARPARGLVLFPGRPMEVVGVADAGLQRYEADVNAALAALDDPDPAARVRAARLLGVARAERAGQPLLAALADPDPGVSLAASEALGRIGDASRAGDLLIALDHPDDQVRLGAARALGLMENAAAVEPLRAMLLQDEGAAVNVAARALANIGTPEALDALLVALADSDMSARRHAALAALEMAGEPAVGPLARTVQGSPDESARRNAAEALGWIGSSQATPALSEALGDRSDNVRKQAVWALGEIGDPDARAALERTATRDRSAAVQAEAQAALGRLAEQPQAAGSRPQSLALVLSQLQPARWLLLIGTWAAAAWLAISSTRLVPATQERPRRSSDA